jgi:hypothetical protein
MKFFHRVTLSSSTARSLLFNFGYCIQCDYKRISADLGWLSFGDLCQFGDQLLNIGWRRVFAYLSFDIRVFQLGSLALEHEIDSLSIRKRVGFFILLWSYWRLGINCFFGSRRS